MKKMLPFPSFSPVLKFAFFCAMLFLMNSFAFAQDCDCDFVIEPQSPTSTVFVDGKTMGVAPGQTICLRAGFYKQIRLANISGAPGNPVTIKNCGGKVQIGDDINFGRWYAVDIVTCSYIRLTGAGVPEFRYGIHLAKSGDSGLKIGVFSTDTEIDHLEIAHTGFAGILAKTDFGGNPPPDAPEMNNVNIHDNYIHDTHGEGMYIGETKSPGQSFRHLEVWNNIITRTGLDLIQVANVVEDIHVHHNVFYQAGLRNVLYQNKGFQIGDNSVGRYYNNFIIGSPSNAMIVMGSGNIDISNNYLEDTGDPAFFIDNRAFSIPGAPVDIHDNFIMDVPGSYPFFQVFNEVNPINITANDLEGSNPLLGYGSGAGANVFHSDNTVGPIERVQFVDPASGDFRLAPGSPYQDLGLMEDISSRNLRPYIAVIGDVALSFGTTLEVPVSAGDPDGDGLVLEAFNMPSFATFKDNGGGNGVFHLAPQHADVGVYYNVRVRVTDTGGSMNTQSFHVTVLDPFAIIATASSTLADTDPSYTLDGDLSTRWAAAEGTGNWIRYDLREDKLVSDMKVSFYNGTSAIYPFAIEVSGDGVQWREVFAGESSGTTSALETFPLNETRARFLRLVDRGTGLNSYNEVVINCVPAPQNVMFAPGADIYVDGKKIVNDEFLKLKHPRVTSYLRFTVSGLDVSNARVISSKLYLTASDDGFGEITVYRGEPLEWTEDATSASSLPAPVAALDTVEHGFTAGREYVFDLADAISDNGTYTFILESETSHGGLSFSSAEGAVEPRLAVETVRGTTTVAAMAMRSAVAPDGTGERAAVNSLTLYPNPVVEETANLYLGDTEAGTVSVEISDRLGRPVYQQRWSAAGPSVEIDLSGITMEPGMYFMKVKRAGRSLEILRMFRR